MTLIFSDTHLTQHFSRKKFKFLKSIIEKADTIIINGDFWDSYFCTFDEFMNSKWKKLFPLLKSRNTTYLYGNHDKKKDMDSRVNLFSNEQHYSYKFKWKTKEVHVEHGHAYDKTRLDKLPFFKHYKKLIRPIIWLAYFVEYINTVWLKNWSHTLENMMLKRRFIEHNKSYSINVFAHTHYAELDLENGFINTGFIKFGIASYVIFGNKKIELIKTKY